MRKWLFLLLFPFVANAATVISGFPYIAATGSPLGNPNPVLVNSSGQVTTTLMSGEDATLNQVWVSTAGSSANYSAAASNNTKASAGEIVGFYVNSTTSGTIQFFNDAVSTCDTNAVTGTITPAVGWHSLPVKMGTGICALTGGTINVTVVYR